MMQSVVSLPSLAPRPYRPAMERHLAPHVALIGSRLQRQQNLGTSHQTLGTGLTSYNLLQTGSLSCRQLHPGGNGRGHMSILAGGLSHFSSYDTIHPVVCILLPSTTRLYAQRP